MPPIAYLKTECEHCSGHIEYPAELAGQSVQCPHCQQTITLPDPLTPPVATRPDPPSIPTPQPTRHIPIRGTYFHWIAAVLFVIGLLFLRESEEEQFENKMLSSAYNVHSAASQSYQATAQLYLLGGTSRGSVDRAEARTKEASEKVDTQQQRLSGVAVARRLKMFLFFAGAAVFFIGGVVQPPKPRTCTHTPSMDDTAV